MELMEFMENIIKVVEATDNLTKFKEVIIELIVLMENSTKFWDGYY